MIGSSLSRTFFSKVFSTRSLSFNASSRIKAIAKTIPRKTILLPEGHDLRVIKAASESVKSNVADVGLIGNPQTIEKLASDGSIDISKVRILNPETDERLEEISEKFKELRKKKGISLEEARIQCLDPQFFGNMLVRCGYADGTVSGAVATSGKTAQAAVWCLGKQPGIECASSFFVMSFPPESGKKSMIYADCGFVIDPTASQLACIAETSAKSCRSMLGEEPKIALLSFSTYQSASHPHVDKVREAVEIVRKRSPSLIIDGDLQVDAAIVPEIANKKAPSSPVAGDANVFIFPDLQSGNIAYKITERLAGAQALGPIFQGLAYAANDVSRGCSADDLLLTIAITAIQAEERLQSLTS